MDKITALVARVSTDRQAEEGYSIGIQEEKMLAFCKTRDFDNPEHYTDPGYTGSNMDRPELQRLISDIKAGKVCRVIVYKLDRISRSLRDMMYLIEEVFLPNKVDFISLTENLDTSTPLGRVVIVILSAFAQLERELIRERTRMGMQKRVADGLWMGGGRVPFGFDYDEEQGILVHNQDTDKVRQIYSLYLQGYSTVKLAKLFGWGTSDRIISQILKRKINYGTIEYNGELYAGQHEAIISEDTYNNAMKMMEERSRRYITNTRHYLLSGLVHCGVCGAKMRYQKWKPDGVKLVCYSRHKSKEHMIKDANCKNILYWSHEVEGAVLEKLFNLSVQYQSKSLVQVKENATTILHRQYSETSTIVKRLYTLYGQAANPVLLETINDHQKRLEELHKQIESERESNKITNMHFADIEKLTNLKQTWEYMTITEKQEIIKLFFEKISLNQEASRIDYVDWLFDCLPHQLFGQTSHVV